jgi:hypothetical protein
MAIELVATVKTFFSWRFHIWVCNGEIFLKHGTECDPKAFCLLDKRGWSRLVDLNERDIINIWRDTALLWLD